MVGWGALSLTTWSLPPCQPFPKRHQGPGNSSTRWARRSKLCSTTRTSTSPPPKPAWRLTQSLGKIARFAGLKTFPLVISHRCTRLGVQARERTVYLAGPHTHTHAPAADQGVLPPTNGTARHSPYGRAQLKQCPPGVLGQRLDLTAPPRIKAGYLGTYYGPDRAYNRVLIPSYGLSPSSFWNDIDSGLPMLLLLALPRLSSQLMLPA